ASMVCVTSIVVARTLAGRRREVIELRERRLGLLAESLRDPALDPAVRAELLRALAHEHQGVGGWLWHRLRTPAAWRFVAFTAGWFGLLLGGVYLLMGATGAWGYRWHAGPAVLVLVL